MKVYELDYVANYGGGLMIVAADSPEEASKIAKRKSTSWKDPQEIEGLTYNGESGIISFGYHEE